MASNLERITKACEEMKRLYGIPEEKVKAALKQLHNFHGNAWSRIEENNYKAILEWTSEEKISQTLEYSKRRGALSIQEGKMYQNLEPEVVHILSDDESEKPDTQLKRRKRIYNEKVLSIEDGKDTVTQKINKLELYQNGYHKPLLEEHVLKYESPIAEIHPVFDMSRKSVSDKDKGQDRKKIIYASNGGDVGNPSLKSENKSNEVPNDRRNSSAVTKSSIFVEDITRGEENEPISLVGDNSSSLKLPEFFYISRNIVYNNAYVNFSLARLSDQNYCSNCCGDCLAAPANCACTCETRGDFAYTRQGLLEEKFIDECIGVSRRRPKKEYLYYCENCPLENSSLVTDGKQQKRKKSKKACKGHLMRKFIKECWAKCGCSRICGNRVVQRGITVKLQVFQTPEGKGWGVRTLQQLEKGTFVCEYVGEIVTNLELHERNERSAGDEHTYPVLLDADWASERHLKDEDALCLDATKFGNVARCYDANLVEVPVEVETPDHHYYHIAFFTSRKIEANEELTWDYGIDFEDETHPIKAFDCKCGSFFCGMKNRSSR